MKKVIFVVLVLLSLVLVGCSVNNASEPKQIELSPEMIPNQQSKTISTQIEDCKKLPETTYGKNGPSGYPRDSCLIEIASKYIDAELCNGVSKANIERCFNRIAVITLNPDLCRGIGSTYTTCLLESSDYDIKVCDRIDSAWDKDTCISSVASQKSDFSYCSEIELEIFKRGCRGGVIGTMIKTASNNTFFDHASFCNSFNDAYLENICWEVIISRTQNLTREFCEGLEDSGLQDTCWDTIITDVLNDRLNLTLTQELCERNSKSEKVLQKCLNIVIGKAGIDTKRYHESLCAKLQPIKDEVFDYTNIDVCYFKLILCEKTTDIPGKACYFYKAITEQNESICTLVPLKTPLAGGNPYNVDRSMCLEYFENPKNIPHYVQFYLEREKEEIQS